MLSLNVPKELFLVTKKKYFFILMTLKLRQAKNEGDVSYDVALLLSTSLICQWYNLMLIDFLGIRSKIWTGVESGVSLRIWYLIASLLPLFIADRHLWSSKICKRKSFCKDIRCGNVECFYGIWAYIIIMCFYQRKRIVGLKAINLINYWLVKKYV